MATDRGRIVTVAVCRRPGLAQLASSILDAAGIESFIQGEHAGGLSMGAMASRVVVREADADEALTLLSAEGLEVDTPVEVDDSPIEPGERGSRTRLIYLLLVLAAIGALAIVRSLG